ncbi:MAG: VWA domain-containing protein [Fimbriimonas sp.]
MIQFHSILPVVQVLAVVLAAVALSMWLHWKEVRRGGASRLLLGIRAVTILIVGLLILNPVKVESAAKPEGKSPILVLVDTSHSMAVSDVNGRPRIDAVRKALFTPQVSAALARGHAPTYFEFSKEATTQPRDTLARPGPVKGNQTLVGESLAKAISSAGAARTGAILLVSDGRDNGEIAPAEVARQAKTRGFPVFTVCVGKETKTKDLAVVMNRPQVFTSPDQEVALGADVVASGVENVPLSVRLMREGKQIAKKSVNLQPGGHTEVTFSTKEKSKGTYRYSIEVSGVSGEVTTANNRASSLLTVGNATTQILVLEGRPTWEAKFLIQALRSDPSLSVDAIYQLTKDRAFAVQGVVEDDSEGKGQVKLPKTRAEFAKYDVVIVGKGSEEFFTDEAATQLKEYVAEGGGHLIFLRGEAAEGASPLAALEPVTWDTNEIRDFRMKVTEEGASNPAFGFSAGGDAETVIQKLPSMISATRVAKEKALTVVLARASGTANGAQPNQEMAVLAYQRFGDGLVLSLVGQGLWRWALLSPDLVDYSNCYNDFWTQMIRWMVNQSDFLPGQNVTLRTDRYAFSPGETVNLMAFVRGGNQAPLSPVTITGPGGKTVQIGLSKAKGKQADFLGTFHPKAPGDYIATLSQPGNRGGQVTAPFSVYERQQEDMNTSADPGLMARIAKAGGGKALSLSEIKDLPRLLKESEAWFQRKPEPQSLWDRWEVLAVILGFLSAEWFIRRRLGMV